MALIMTCIIPTAHQSVLPKALGALTQAAKLMYVVSVLQKRPYKSKFTYIHAALTPLSINEI